LNSLFSWYERLFDLLFFRPHCIALHCIAFGLDTIQKLQDKEMRHTQAIVALRLLLLHDLGKTRFWILFVVVVLDVLHRKSSSSSSSNSRRRIVVGGRQERIALGHCNSSSSSSTFANRRTPCLSPGSLDMHKSSIRIIIMITLAAGSRKGGYLDGSSLGPPSSRQESQQAKKARDGQQEKDQQTEPDQRQPA
jgi:hypothetical protein